MPVKQVTGGGATGSTGGTGTSLDGTYTISLPPGDDGCGTPSLSAETLTVNGTTASITAVNGQTPFHGTATTTGSTFSIHITNGITGAAGSPLAPGAIVIDLTGSIEPNGVLSGQSVNSGVYPGGTNGFGCTSPFTATRTSATVAPPPSSRPPPPPRPVSAAPLQTATAGDYRRRHGQRRRSETSTASTPARRTSAARASSRYIVRHRRVGERPRPAAVTILFIGDQRRPGSPPAVSIYGATTRRRYPSSAIYQPASRNTNAPSTSGKTRSGDIGGIGERLGSMIPTRRLSAQRATII